FTLSGHFSLLLDASNYTEKNQNKLTVLDFGAVGDGKADDSDAVQRAVNSETGDIHFPKGIYRITKNIVIDLDKTGPVSIEGCGTAKIVMAGAGPVFKFIGTHEGTASPASFKENVWKRQRMPFIEGLEIEGSHPEAVGIEITGTMQTTFTRLLIRNCLHGIHLTKRNRNVIISECHFYHNKGIGIFLDDVNLHQINVNDCHISYNGGGGIVVSEGDVRNLQICGCDIEANMNPDGPPTANVLLKFTKGYGIGEGAIVGCTIQHSPYAPNSANIRFIGSNVGSEPNVKNFTIANNALSDVRINIHLNYARGITITGNTIWRGYDRDILAENCTDILIGNNIFDRNPSYSERKDGKACMRGLFFKNCRDCILSGLQIKEVYHQKGALILEKCRRININNCSIFDSDGCGIFVNDAEIIRISDCMIINDKKSSGEKTAIKLINGKNNTIINNFYTGKLDILPDYAHLENNHRID
ncbi:right-handed parallel beta-helix repeat-containing protein, partial [bacterium]|nr:right-handed parallel beta-helix repeat-containing protein [bacterium]